MTVRVGIFVLVGLVILIGFSLRVREQGVGRDSYMLTAYFEEALGLEKGADVSLRGVRIGRVDEIRFDPARKAVVAELKVDKEYPLPVDSVATIERSTLLGTSFIVVRYGDAGDKLAANAELKTESVPGINELVAEVTKASTEAREMMAKLRESGDELFAKVEAVVDENREQLKTTSDSFASAGPKLDAIATRLDEFTASVQQGQGTLGRLYKDESLYTDLQKVSAQLNEVVADMKSNEGTLHRLIYDDTLAKQAEDGFAKLGGAGEEVQKLIADRRADIEKAIDSLSSLGPKIDEAATNFGEISAKINKGEGTVGKLVNDPSLYEDAQRTVNQVGETFEGSEEQGVIRSFVGVLFGALI